MKHKDMLKEGGGHTKGGNLPVWAKGGAYAAPGGGGTFREESFA